MQDLLVSAQYPNKLYRALMNSETVLTAWDGDKLVGLARAIDDGAILAQVHYVLVRPSYQGQGIAGALIERIRAHYKDYFCIGSMRKMSPSASGTAFPGWHMALRSRS